MQFFADLYHIILTRTWSRYMVIMLPQRILRIILSLHLDIALIVSMRAQFLQRTISNAIGTAIRLIFRFGCWTLLANIERFGCDRIRDTISTRS